jgi:uncharacterized protein
MSESGNASKLTYIRARSQGNFASYDVSLPAKLERMLESADLTSLITKGDYVAIKSHFGSWGGHRIIRPIFMKKIVDAVKKAGGKPFVTDTTRIPGIEYLEAASQNGINEATLGCPVIMADGLFGKDSEKVQAGTMGEIGIASAIFDAPVMIVATHCKGHIGAGFGGAIKNISMGCVSGAVRGEGKNRARIHAMESERVEWISDNCILCQECIKSCDHGAIELYHQTIVIDHAECQKCGRCTRICPEHALILETSEKRFHHGMADVTRAVLDTFEEGKILYLNFILEVMPHCDCHQHSDVPIINDQGILMGDDPLAIDMASMDIIENAKLCPDSAADGHESGPGLFKRITKRNASYYLDRCAEAGVGKKEWTIEMID